jgi:UDP-N-acetylglucosamine--N-acetylmuramyl-(pentapeptide) pyrophosphoryl-undecaprenol N-acetylglucosamine transferase
VYPGLAVRSAFRRLAAEGDLSPETIWIGSTAGVERAIVEAAGMRFIGIPSGKLRRYISLKNVVDLFKVVAGIAAATIIMMRYRPKVLFSKGGYVSVPPAIAASLAKVPVITHESDFDPGLATRINARFASIVMVSYDETKAFFPETYEPKVITVGNPARPEMLAADGDRGRRTTGFKEHKPILLVLGGSQGAAELNRLVWDALPALLESWNVVHQTGPDRSGPPENSGYRRFSYIFDEYPDIFAAADLVLCRAGATTLTELTALRKPSILLPLGRASSRGDQIRNAQLFRGAGASYILSGAGEASELLNVMKRFLDDPEELNRMGRAAGRLHIPDAAERIAKVLKDFTFGESRNEFQPA